jgi:hypothetical protein
MPSACIVEEEPVTNRLLCRLVGHKWKFVPGVSHGHDVLFECHRCGIYDWRDQDPRTSDES